VILDKSLKTPLSEPVISETTENFEPPFSLGFENGEPCKKTPVECSITARAATQCAEEYAKETSSTLSRDIYPYRFSSAATSCDDFKFSALKAVPWDI
jgi:hypothetical protein